MLESRESLSRCRRLARLALRRGSFDLTNILTFFGRNFVSLEYTPSNPFLETVNVIVKHCPILQMLDLGDEELDAVDFLKGGVNKLSKLKVYGVSVRPGIYWEVIFDEDE
jgi:hypothetical protein